MKKLIMLFCLFACFVANVYAREPYGDYICRYIVTYNSQTNETEYHQIYNPIKITHMGIRAENTNKGTKTWLADYRGTNWVTVSGNSEKFHNFYLTKQYVEFSISDRKFLYYNGKFYYIIILDGQMQLAEPRY